MHEDVWQRGLAEDGNVLVDGARSQLAVRVRIVRPWTRERKAVARQWSGIVLAYEATVGGGGPRTFGNEPHQAVGDLGPDEVAA